MTRRKVLIFSSHILFCILLIKWFHGNSYIRPYTVFHPYKEIIVALLLLFVIYVNFFVLIPHFFNKIKLLNYFLVSLLVLLGVSIIEFFLVKSDVLRCLGGIEDAIKTIYFRNMLLMIFLRYSGFYLFFTVLKFYLLTQSNAFIEKKTVLRNTGFIVLNPIQGKPITLNINFISYFSQDKNNTFIHYTRGATIPVYSSLNHIQEYLGSMCLRVNKENIITFTNIISYNNERVMVAGEKNNLPVSLIYSKNFAQNILQSLREKVPDLEEKNFIILQKNQSDIVNSDEKNEIDHVNDEILEEIIANPGINAVKLYHIFRKKMSLITLRRRLKKLVDSHLIEYRGSSKSGGYYSVLTDGRVE
jgi:hypothetical protein